MGKLSKKKSRSKKKPTSSAAPQRRLLLRSVLLLVFATFTVVLLAGWGNWLWKQVGPYVQTSEEYLLQPDLIELTPEPPPWVRGDIRADVIQRAGWDQPLSMLEDQLPQRIADAFEFHPWVERAKVTLQYPAHAQVELTYRRPAARLQVESRAGEEQIVLDPLGFRLPESEMTPKEIARLPLVTDTVGIHLPLIGQSLEESRLLGAAEIAGILINDWNDLGLETISPLIVLQGDSGDRTQVYQLTSGTMQSYLWGAAPRQASEQELSPDEKLKRLKAAVRRVGEHASTVVAPIDLRLPNSGM